jgi:hypothetical protein
VREGSRRRVCVGRTAQGEAPSTEHTRYQSSRSAANAHVYTRLPGYGRHWVAQREAGLAPSGWLSVVRQWPRTPPKWCLVVPGDQDPAQYNMNICAGLAVIVACSSHDVGNAVLISLIEEAKPAVGVVLVDREFSTWLGESPT